MMKRINKLFFITIFFIILGANLWAATKTWKKTTSSRNWDIESNWEEGSVPTANDDVIIPAVNAGSSYPEVPSGVPVKVKSLTIEVNGELSTSTMAKLIINQNCNNKGSIKLDYQSTLICNGSFTNTASATLNVGDVSKATLNISKDFINNGTVNLKGENTSLTLSADFINNGNVNNVDMYKKIVKLTPTDSTVTIKGTSSPTKTQFHTLTFPNGGGKKLIIDGKITIVDTFDFHGASPSSRLIIDGKNNAQIHIPDDRTGSKFLDVYVDNVWINNGTGTPQYEASSSIGHGSNTSVGGAFHGWKLDSITPITSTTKTWQGGAWGNATKWNEDANWLPAGVPDVSTDVEIPNWGSGGNYPELSSNIEIKSLKIASGAGSSSNPALNFNGKNLTISETLENNAEHITGARLRFNGPDSKIKGSEELSFSVLIINNNKKLTLEQNITIVNSFKNTGTFDAKGKTVTLKPTGTVTIEGGSGGLNPETKTKFAQLLLEDGGGKTLKIVNPITVKSDLILKGEDSSNRLKIDGINGRIHLTSNQTNNAEFLDINTDNVQIASKTYTVKNSLNKGNPAGATINGWKFASTTPATAEWTGALDSTWNNVNNWKDALIPGTNTTVTIPVVTSGNYPTLAGTLSETPKAKFVIVNHGAELDLADKLIENGINPPLGPKGTPKITVRGTLKLIGTEEQKKWFEDTDSNEAILLMDDDGLPTIIYYSGTGTPHSTIWDGPYYHLTIEGGRNILPNSDIAIKGNFINNGTFTASSPSTVTFTENSAEISGTGNTTFNDLSIATGSNIITLKQDIKIKGNFSNTGKFASDNGTTVTLSSDANHTITGTLTAANTQFSNLTMDSAGGQSLKIKNKITVGGNLILKGSGSTSRLKIEPVLGSTGSIHLASPQETNSEFLKVDTEHISITDLVGSDTVHYKTVNSIDQDDSQPAGIVNGWSFG